MKGLPPVLRERKRYIAFRLIFNHNISEPEDSSNLQRTEIETKDLALAIWNNLISLFGDYYSANSGVWLEEFNQEYGILRCHSHAVDKIKVALTLTARVSGVNMIPVILGVSGTIKKCKSKYIGGVKNADAANGL
ncbi:MAG: Rpp14/Pop5 family protein [Archaeoglobaceae archaeon]